MNKYVKNLIENNTQATTAIKSLETTISNIEIKTEKDKANFGNLCIILKGYRMVAEGTECLLRNENIIKTDTDEFYAKIETNENPDNSEQQQR